MGRYLVVAHQTGMSPELLDGARQIASQDTDPEFTLLVPATPVSHLLTSVPGEARALAESTAKESSGWLRKEGINVVRTAIGDASPIAAISDEMRDHPGYDAIVICTFKPGISRWLKMDLPRRAQRSFSVPVIHVIAESRSRVAQS